MRQDPGAIAARVVANSDALPADFAKAPESVKKWCRHVAARDRRDVEAVYREYRASIAKGKVHERDQAQAAAFAKASRAGRGGRSTADRDDPDGVANLRNGGGPAHGRH